MIPLLVLVLLVEGAVASLLILKMGPFTELTIRTLDQLQTGRGSPTIKTLACTMSLILLSSLTSILKIGRKGVKVGTTTPMDQVLWSTHVLEASLMEISKGVLPLFPNFSAGFREERWASGILTGTFGSNLVDDVSLSHMDVKLCIKNNVPWFYSKHRRSHGPRRYGEIAGVESQPNFDAVSLN